MDRDYSGWAWQGPPRQSDWRSRLSFPQASENDKALHDIPSNVIGTMANGMIPAGYLYKRVAPCPGWPGLSRHIEDVYSISRCISNDFADYTHHWRHNECWLFDDPKIMTGIASEQGVSLEGAKLFFYEIYDQQFDEATRYWSPIFADRALPKVVIPVAKHLQGYDVNCASQDNLPECSPLSCNGLCSTLPVNKHCLMDTFEEACAGLEAGRFDRSEPGPFRIYAVYTVTSID